MVFPSAHFPHLPSLKLSCHHFIQTFALDPLVFQCFQSLVSPTNWETVPNASPFQLIPREAHEVCVIGERQCDPRSLFQRSKKLCLQK